MKENKLTIKVEKVKIDGGNGIMVGIGKAKEASHGFTEEEERVESDEE